jgi:hypothetical protein
VTVRWSPTATVLVRIFDGASNVVGSTSQTGTSATLRIPGVPAGGYRVQLKVRGVKSVAFTLGVGHC